MYTQSLVIKHMRENVLVMYNFIEVVTVLGMICFLIFQQRLMHFM